MCPAMIDNFSLGLTHGLMLLAAWRMLSRLDLDREAPPVPAPPPHTIAEDIEEIFHHHA
jgi:hypothetical protein